VADLIAVSKTDLFERFINMILNDFVYCMDEAISKIEIIKNNNDNKNNNNNNND
jgi:hypothetical protein